LLWYVGLWALTVQRLPWLRQASSAGRIARASRDVGEACTANLSTEYK
jgi:hypothetical protein